MLSKGTVLGELEAGKRSQGGQGKRYKDTVKVSLKCCTVGQGKRCEDTVKVSLKCCTVESTRTLGERPPEMAPHGVGWSAPGRLPVRTADSARPRRNAGCRSTDDSNTSPSGQPPTLPRPHCNRLDPHSTDRLNQPSCLRTHNTLRQQQ